MALKTKQWIFLVKFVVLLYLLSIVFFVTYFPDRDFPDKKDADCELRNKEIKQELDEARYALDNISVLTVLEREEATRRQVGLGAYGTDIDINSVVLTPDDKQLRDSLLEKHGYDAFVSDLVSIYRVLPDNRPQVCKVKVYPDLPPVSVVIPFRDERLSVLLRTIYSVLQNTPDALLAEIILIDDGSVTTDLKSRLDMHLFKLPKVRVIRLSASVGLMKARQTGIDVSKSDYFICMDCHIEVVTGWVEPLLGRLIENPKALLSSNVGLLKRDTFGVDLATRWIFDRFAFFIFNLDETPTFYRKEYLKSRNDSSDPLPLGMVQGMVIAMKKSWFMQLGGFDTGMKVWGSEQIELSIKVWTCGGVVEMIPCSFIAHLFKSRLVYDVGLSRTANILRVAEVWMDNYKDAIYELWPWAKKKVDTGDLTYRKILRKQNRCKPFQYFVDKVSEFAHMHMPLQSRLRGSIINTFYGRCINRSENSIIMSVCYREGGLSQYFEYTRENQIRHLSKCIYPVKDGKGSIYFGDCYIQGEEASAWKYTEASTLIHIASNLCLTAADNLHSISVQQCTGSGGQLWLWKPMENPG